MTTKSLLVCLAICVTIVVAKDWTCPKPSVSGVGLCAFSCQSDNECPGRQKCCTNSCGGTDCTSPPGGTRPYTRPSSSNTATDKRPASTQGRRFPRSCPLVEIACIRRVCFGDRDCPGLKKCCANGCICI